MWTKNQHNCAISKALTILADIEKAVWENFEEQPLLSKKDRLFDILMSFLDLLAPYHKTIQPIYNEIKLSPNAYLELYPYFKRWAKNVLEKSGFNENDWSYIFAEKIFLLQFHLFLMDWIKINPDNSDQVMMELDKMLNSFFSYKTAFNNFKLFQ